MSWFDYSRYLKSLSFELENFSLYPLTLEIVCYLVPTLLLLILIVKYFYWPLDLPSIYLKEDGDNNNVYDCRKYFTYPNGWIPVAESFLFKFGQIERVNFCGQSIVLLRGSNGKAFALDAFCPHLGADFSVGGKIVKHCDDDCVRCPFHGWVFRAQDGMCVEVPYAQDKKPPQGAKVKVWKCLEMNGFIYVWHHTEGLEPTWIPPRIEEIESKKWTYRGRVEHIVDCSTREIPENGADPAHFNELHAPPLMRGEIFFESRNFIIDSLRQTFQCSWRKCEPPEGHKALFSLNEITNLFGHKLIEIDIQGSEQIGPALVNLKLNVTVAKYLNFKGAFIQGLTPLEPCRQKIVNLMFVEEKWLSRLLSTITLFGVRTMVDRDCLIWRDKRYLDNPMLVKEEKQIAEFRRWYKQFHSEPPKKNCNGLDSW